MVVRRFNDLRRDTKIAIIIFAAVVAGLIAIAFYGWATGAWEKFPFDWRESAQEGK
jgi:hypothetical protein